MKKLRYYRAAHAADYAGVSRSAIYAAIRREQIGTAETACGLQLISQGELDRWIDGAEQRQENIRQGRPPKGAKG